MFVYFLAKVFKFDVTNIELEVVRIVHFEFELRLVSMLYDCMFFYRKKVATIDSILHSYLPVIRHLHSNRL